MAAHCFRRFSARKCLCCSIRMQLLVNHYRIISNSKIPGILQENRDADPVIKYADAKSQLQEIFQRVSLNHKPLDHLLKYSAVNLSNLDHKPEWLAVVKMAWPTDLEIPGIPASRKIASEQSAAAFALENLKELGVLDKDDNPILYTEFELKQLLLQRRMPEFIDLSPETRSTICAIVHKHQEVSSLFSAYGLTDTDFCKTDDLPELDDFDVQHNHKLCNADADLNEHKLECGENADSTILDVMKGDLYQPLSQKDSTDRSQQLFRLLNARMNSMDPAVKEILSARQRLPIAQYRKQILQSIENNQVIVLCGETGCGKTTQVPQYILEEWTASMRGAECNIVVTQPRRISTISVAQRLAHERGEWLGSTVGYQVRLDYERPTECGAILFCTPGILLRKLQSNASLTGVSHVIVDEVHERNLMTDFLLILLREIAQKNPDLRIILMSATINAELFSKYFNNCPIIDVPGFLHPVTDHYLPDIERMLDCRTTNISEQQLEESVILLRVFLLPSPDPCQEEPSNGFKHNFNMFLQNPYQPHFRTVAKCFVEMGQKTMANFNSDFLKDSDDEDETNQTLPVSRPKVDCDFVANLVKHICDTRPPGGILVFLPGWQEISLVRDLLKAELSDADRYSIFPVHSRIAQEEQNKIFTRLPESNRKIVLSTNITETAMTINDIVYVIDPGIERIQTHNHKKGISCLDTVWASQASIRQRRGRAGRVRSGECFHLFDADTVRQMSPYLLPEMHRVPLEQLVLEAKLYSNDKTANEFLALSLEPPDKQAIESAVEVLQSLGIMDEEENLTILGRRLAHFTSHPRLSKMLVYATLFRCCDPLLIVASVLTQAKELFHQTLENRSLIKEIRQRFAMESQSDHLTFVNLFHTWLNAKRQGWEAEKRFNQANLVNKFNMEFLRGLRELYSEHLYDAYLTEDVESSLDPLHMNNQYSHKHELVKAMLLVGFYSNVAKIKTGSIYKGRIKETAVVMTSVDDQQRLHIHRSSINKKEGQFDSSWLTFYNKVMSAEMGMPVLRDCSTIHPLALVLFGGNEIHLHLPTEEQHEFWEAELKKEDRSQLNETADKDLVILTVDGSTRMSFCCYREVAEKLIEFRKVMNELIQFILQQPKVLSEEKANDDEAVIEARCLHCSVLKCLTELLHQQVLSPAAAKQFATELPDDTDSSFAER